MNKQLKKDLASALKQQPTEVVKVLEKPVEAVVEQRAEVDDGGHAKRVAAMKAEIKALEDEIKRLRKILADLKHQIQEAEAAGMVRSSEVKKESKKQHVPGFFIPQYDKHEISFSTRKVFERLYRDAFERWGRLQELRTQWGQRSDQDLRKILESLLHSNPCHAFSFDEPSPFAQTEPRPAPSPGGPVGYAVESRERQVKWTQSKGVASPHFWEKERLVQTQRLTPSPSLPFLSSTLQKKGVLANSGKAFHASSDPRSAETLRPQTSPAGQDAFRTLFQASTTLLVDGSTIGPAQGGGGEPEAEPPEPSVEPEPKPAPRRKEPRPASREPPGLGPLVRPKSRDGAPALAASRLHEPVEMSWANWGEPR